MPTLTEHMQLMNRARKEHQECYEGIWTAAQAHNVYHDRITPNELRKLSCMDLAFAALDRTRAAITAVEDAAIKDHCAYRDSCGVFGWYSSRDARKFRAAARKRGSV